MFKQFIIDSEKGELRFDVVLSDGCILNNHYEKRQPSLV